MTQQIEASSAPGSAVLGSFSDALAGAVERAGASVVQVDARRRQGASGIVWTADGVILTADHALERDEDLTIGLPDGRTVGATVIGRDSGTDVALLRAQATGLEAIARGAAPKVGHLALMVARPSGSLATSIGVISALGGPVRTWRGGRLEGIIWTDATFYPGFSGGALINTAGEMSAMGTAFRYGSGMGIPVETLERVTATLLSHGRVRRGFLGVSSQPVELPESLRKTAGLSQESALLIVGVEPGGPADKGGVIIGDVLVGLAGQPVSNTDDLLSLLGAERVGQSTAVRVLRGGEPHDLTVTIGERK